MPAISANVTVNVVTSSPFQVGQVLFIPTAGYFQIASKPTTAQLSLTNLGYTGNAVAGTVFGAGFGVSPAGLIGPTGPAGVTPTMNQISPTTTKGDMLYDDGANAPLASVKRLPVSTNGFVLHTISAVPTWSKIDMSGANTGLINQLPIAFGGTGQNNQQSAIIALLPFGLVDGDLFQMSGGNVTRLTIGTAYQKLRVNAGATGAQYGYGGTLQFDFTTSATYTSSAATYPGDNTVPLIGGGFQLITRNFTPVSASSKIIVEAAVQFDTSGNDTATIALFAGNTCIGSMIVSVGTGALVAHRLPVVYSPGSAAAITFTMRAGTVGGNTVYINGNASNRLGGGSQSTYLKITEMA